MKFIVARALPAIAAVAFVAPLLAADGVLIVERTTSGGTSEVSQMQIERNRMRAEITGATGGKQTVIFDGVKQTIDILDTNRKTYNELTKADVDRLGGQMQDAMAMVQAQLASLPPDQRAQIEAMMRGRGVSMNAGAPAAKTTYRKTGTDKVGTWTCDVYEGTQNGQKTSQVCTVDPAALGLTASDFDAAQQLATFFAKILPQSADRLFSIGRAEDQGFSGVPVRRTYYDNGRETTAEITEISRQTFPDSVFAVPAGFTKVDMGRGR